MDYEKHFVLYRSRKTLLKILADRGYTTAPFEKFGPLEISAMISAGAEALRMDLERAAPPAEPATEQPAQEANQLVQNPLEHSLVPKHERVPATEHEALLKKLKVKTKANFPLIKFHEDMIARIIGLMPGEIVRITAASPSAGEYIKYRVCVP